MEKALLVFISPKTGEVKSCFGFEERSLSASMERLAREGFNGFGSTGSADTL